MRMKTQQIKKNTTKKRKLFIIRELLTYATQKRTNENKKKKNPKNTDCVNDRNNNKAKCTKFSEKQKKGVYKKAVTRVCLSS